MYNRASSVAVIASQHAESVDITGRFPNEALQALRSGRLLSIQVPTSLGGEAASITEICEICSILGRACASTAMVFAMHQVMLASVVQYGNTSTWHLDFMKRISADQLLLASSTTEAGVGGNVRNSVCAIERDGRLCQLQKDATVISYGEYADAILVTSRADPSASPEDQLLTVFLKDQFTLDKTRVWNTLGMRGTCSDGFIFKGQTPTEQILPSPFSEIASQSMLATSHILWAGVWYGIAIDAFEKARSFLRNINRKSRDVAPSASLHLAEASSILQSMKADIIFSIREYREAKAKPQDIFAMNFAITMDSLKIKTSRAVLEVINHAMLICGLSGYANDGPYSIARNLRDAHSAQLMISNDRILGNTGRMLLAYKQKHSLTNEA